MDTRRLTVTEDDPLRSYTVEEEQRLAQNLFNAASDVYRGAYRDRSQDLGLLCELHARLFDGVRDHAGRYRERGRGAEYLNFGPHRSSHRDVVKAELEQVIGELRTNVRRCLDAPDAPNYDEACLHIAAKVHADLIKVHPFEDGNGRSTRLFMVSVLVALGLLPVEIEAPRQEYLTCLNHYFQTRELRPLIDLCARLYAEKLGL